MSRVYHDGGCYMLTQENYHQLLSCTRVRNHMIQELHILLVQTEAELHHILRLIEDNLHSSSRNQDPSQLHGSLIDLLQCIREIRRQHYTAMMEQHSCPDLPTQTYEQDLDTTSTTDTHTQLSSTSTTKIHFPHIVTI